MDENEVEIPIVGGIDKALEFVAALTDEIAAYRAFAEDVLLACLMPETPRYSLQYDGEDENISSAESALYQRMGEWRKMTAWFQSNNIDLDAVLGREGKDKKKKRN